MLIGSEASERSGDAERFLPPEAVLCGVDGSESVVHQVHGEMKVNLGVVGGG